MEYKAYLLCIKDVVVDGDDWASCIKGKTYQVSQVTFSGHYIIINEQGLPHHFHRSKNEGSYYGNWFEMELA